MRQQSPPAVLFLLLGAGSGFCLGGMDVLYDIEHGISSQGTSGRIELAVNVVTVVASTVLSRWVWVHRRELDPERGEGGVAGQ